MSDDDRRALAAIRRVLTTHTGDPDTEAREILTILRGHGWRPTEAGIPPDWKTTAARGQPAGPSREYLAIREALDTWRTTT